MTGEIAGMGEVTDGRYADFDQRMVERALRKHHRPGAQQAAMITTVS